MPSTDVSTLPVPAGARTEWKTADPRGLIFEHRITVNRRWWSSAFSAHGFPDLLIGERISRGELFCLADDAQDNPTGALTLLWNSVAWGSGRTVRNVNARMTAVAEDPRSAGEILQEAAQASRSDPKRGYALLRPNDRRNSIRSLGPAFFTKFLYFAGGGEPDHPCCILDARVATALHAAGWGSLPITGPWRATDYEHYSDLLQRWKGETDVPRLDIIERWLFEAGAKPSAARTRSRSSTMPL